MYLLEFFKTKAICNSLRAASKKKTKVNHNETLRSLRTGVAQGMD